MKLRKNKRKAVKWINTRFAKPYKRRKTFIMAVDVARINAERCAVVRLAGSGDVLGAITSINYTSEPIPHS